MIENLPQDFFRDEEEYDIVIKVEDWTEQPKNIAEMLYDNYGMTVDPAKLKGLKARIRHVLGVEAIPLQVPLKLRDMKGNDQEYRKKKLLGSGGLKPLPEKHIDLKTAQNKTELRYLIEYGIVKKMYRDYIERKTTLKAYKDARKWFHDKYGE